MFDVIVELMCAGLGPCTVNEKTIIEGSRQVDGDAAVEGGSHGLRIRSDEGLEEGREEG